MQHPHLHKICLITALNDDGDNDPERRDHAPQIRACVDESLATDRNATAGALYSVRFDHLRGDHHATGPLPMNGL